MVELDRGPIIYLVASAAPGRRVRILPADMTLLTFESAMPTGERKTLVAHILPQEGDGHDYLIEGHVERRSVVHRVTRIKGVGL